MILHQTFNSSFASLTLIAGLAASVIACGGNAGSDGSSASTGAGEDALRGGAHAPIPQVLQYVGGYTGEASFSALELRRDGTFIATINGARETGRFEGPKAKADALSMRIVFVTHGDTFLVSVPDGWTEKQTLLVTHAGAAETLTSTWNAGTEQMCDDTRGQWQDDDPDPSTGLFCLCAAPNFYIPSAGGCVP